MNDKQKVGFKDVLVLENPVYVHSNDFVKTLSQHVNTFHHHFHIILALLEHRKGTFYFEIGCYTGASAITALQCSKIKRVVTMDTFDAIDNQLDRVKSNLQTFANTEGKQITILHGSSHEKSMVTAVYQQLLQDPTFFGFDLFFVDGDHSFSGVQQDFKYYEPLLHSMGGYVVFDDYADHFFSPQVCPAVDDIVQKNSSNFAILGQPYNLVNSFGNGLVSDLSNEFVLQKKQYQNLLETDAKYIVCIATYERANGTTKRNLERLLDCIESQTFTKWFVILIGDNYENSAEFDEISRRLPKEKMLAINLPIAGERDCAAINGVGLWRCAGCCAVNYSLLLCQLYKPDCVYTHADDDDVWYPHHLEEIDRAYAKNENAAFVWTMGKHSNNQILPPNIEIADAEYTSLHPRECTTLHSSVSWKIDKFPLRYRICDNRVSDGDMWERMTEHMVKQNFGSILVKKVTIEHPTQQY